MVVIVGYPDGRRKRRAASTVGEGQNEGMGG